MRGREQLHQLGEVVRRMHDDIDYEETMGRRAGARLEVCA
jgi:hypothetical protein